MTDTNVLTLGRRSGCPGFLAALLLCVTLNVSAAERLVLSGLGEPPFADSETSSTFALPRADGQNWRLTLCLAGTPSNRVEIAFGRDANTNGVLDAEEMSAAVGWDRGVWAAAGGAGLGERYTAAPSDCALTLDVRLAADGSAESAAFREPAAPLAFEGLAAMPAWLDPRQWDIARLTARGAGVRAEAAEIVSFADGTSVRIK